MAILPEKEYTAVIPRRTAFTLAWMVPGQSYVTFQLRGCKEARVALAQTPFNASDGAYEVVIGYQDNMASKINRNVGDQNPVVSVVTENILDCYTYRPFWIRFDQVHGKISVGQGVLDSGLLMEWQDGSPHKVHAVGFGTGDREEVAVKFGEEAGEM